VVWDDTHWQVDTGARLAAYATNYKGINPAYYYPIVANLCAPEHGIFFIYAFSGAVIGSPVPLPRLGSEGMVD
jgi:hypothetical protein